MTEPDRYVRITGKNGADTWINAAHVVAFEEHTDDEVSVVTLHLGPGITATAHGTTGDAVAAALAAATTPAASADAEVLAAVRRIVEFELSEPYNPQTEALAARIIRLIDTRRRS